MNFHDTVAPLIYNPDKRPLHGYMRAGGLLANNVDCQHCHGIQQQLGLQHRTVNHSLNFVDPGTGVHTLHIESYWNKCNGRFKAMHGTTIGKLPSYLDEFMWRDRFGRTHQDCFDNIQRHIAEFYPV